MTGEIDAVALMEFAIEIGQEELRSMQKGEIEEVEALFARRSEMMDMALRQKDDVDQPRMRDSLLRMQALQDTLSAEGKKLRTRMVVETNKGKLEAKRLRAYGQSVRQAL